MPTFAAFLVASALALQAPTTIVLGTAQRDLTGDGRPELLKVVGVGPTIENLKATFTIESGGKTIYRYDLAPITRSVGFEGSRQVLSPEQQRVRLKEFQSWFFGEEKFERPAQFVESLRRQARHRVDEIPRVIAGDQQAAETAEASAIWDEILNSSATVFWFSPGGDRIEAIGWSARAGRFYRLLECC